MQNTTYYSKGRNCIEWGVNRIEWGVNRIMRQIFGLRTLEITGKL
jgi:hypothetical protein